MKYTTFMRIRGTVIGAACALLGFGMWSGCRERIREVPVPIASTVVSPTAPDRLEAPAYPNGPTGDKPTKSGQPTKTGKPTQTSSVSGTADFTDVHREILKMQKQPLSKGEDKGDSLRWVVSDAGIKAEFRSDKNKGSKTWNRVKIDYNNNKQYEEKWDFKPDGGVKRQVSPNDDGNYTEEYKLQGEKWVRK